MELDHSACSGCCDTKCFMTILLLADLRALLTRKCLWDGVLNVRVISAWLGTS